MPKDDSRFIQAAANNFNKREGHKKARTIALEKKKGKVRYHPESDDYKYRRDDELKPMKD